ncbi:multiple coagulation factor deficiency protein 2 neural stem cell derived neuronal survival protein [Holotrichia oblita]|uniref:Multiple coagulation factor deficiency protein 2 neural stem cell derived neuronal survival protein n=1 Tax=Holotrichia oblita TaxID=644536 RepID=A0ACB9TA01_HOLOL|nr:multiple coagulation factor deficiency protein 2 neural stem cell derived neuronal survival protein [Holotrichia oblita]
MLYRGRILLSIYIRDYISAFDKNLFRGLDAKSVLTSIASNLMSRGFVTTGGGSQVVSLNLTNLLVLILLKALIFAAGSLGAGTWKGGYGRSSDGEETLVTNEELLMYLAYLTGVPGDNHCLQFIACQGPQQARRYVAAGEMLLKATKMFTDEDDPSHEVTINELRQAANFGLNGGDCNRYSCKNDSTK